MAEGRVLIDVNRCKGCGLCVHVCPAKVLVLTQDGFNAKGYHPVEITNPAGCIGCATCAVICPDTVFTVYRTKLKAQRKPTAALGG